MENLQVALPAPVPTPSAATPGAADAANAQAQKEDPFSAVLSRRLSGDPDPGATHQPKAAEVSAEAASPSRKGEDAPPSGGPALLVLPVTLVPPGAAASGSTAESRNSGAIPFPPEAPGQALPWQAAPQRELEAPASTPVNTALRRDPAPRFDALAALGEPDRQPAKREEVMTPALALPAAADHSQTPLPSLQPPIPAGLPLAAPPVLKIETRLGAPGWDKEMGQQVLWMVGRQEQTAQLHLSPPDLGPVQVVLKLHDDHASALFVSPHPASRDAIEAALPRLKEMMAEAGIRLDNATVSAGSSGEHSAFSQERHPGAPSRPLDDPLLVPTAAVPYSKRGEGLVDTFA